MCVCVRLAQYAMMMMVMMLNDSADAAADAADDVEVDIYDDRNAGNGGDAQQSFPTAASNVRGGVLGTLFPGNAECSARFHPTDAKTPCKLIPTKLLTSPNP